MWIATGSNPCGVAFKQSDSKIYAASGSTLTFGASGVAVTTGVWYRIDFKIDQTNSTNVTIDVQVDGTACGQRAVNPSGNSSPLMIGSQKSVSGDWFYDDWVHSVTGADYPIGAGHVDNFIPASDGTHASTGSDIVKGTTGAPTTGGSITSSTTDAFNWVNGQPILGGASDNTRLINQQTAASGEYVETVFGPGTGVSTPTAAPRAVEVLTVHQQAATQTCNFTTKLNDNGTTSDVVNQGTIAGIASDKYFTKQFATAPTGGAWTVVSGAGNFNNLKARFGFSSDATPDVYWRGIMVEAEFADVAAQPPIGAIVQKNQAVNRASTF
jgi:hypothetical protein